MQSGTGFSRNPRTLAEAEDQGRRLVEAVACDAEPSVTECLRQLPVETLLTALSSTSGASAVWRPSFDGVLFEREPLEALADDSFDPVPTMIGSNTYEALGFLLQLEGITEEEYVAYIEGSTLYGEHSDRLLAAYPVTDYETPHLALSALVGHGRFNCRARRLARELAEVGGDVYLYLYNHGLALHASELLLLFGIGLLPTDQVVSAAMKDYWTSFARTGDPNTGILPNWPRYQVDTDQHLNIAYPITVGSQLLSEECDLWDELDM